MIDDRARAAYHARLVYLRDELEDAEANADMVCAGTARAEMDAIASELAAAFGLGRRAPGRVVAIAHGDQIDGSAATPIHRDDNP